MPFSRSQTKISSFASRRSSARSSQLSARPASPARRPLRPFVAQTCVHGHGKLVRDPGRGIHHETDQPTEDNLAKAPTRRRPLQCHRAGLIPVHLALDVVRALLRKRRRRGSDAGQAVDCDPSRYRGRGERVCTCNTDGNEIDRLYPRCIRRQSRRRAKKGRNEPADCPSAAGSFAMVWLQIGSAGTVSDSTG
jgi:hypothetical protein